MPTQQSKAVELAKLAKLETKGILSQEEFESEKSKLLSGSTGNQEQITKKSRVGCGTIILAIFLAPIAIYLILMAFPLFVGGLLTYLLFKYWDTSKPVKIIVSAVIIIIALTWNSSYMNSTNNVLNSGNDYEASTDNTDDNKLEEKDTDKTTDKEVVEETPTKEEDDTTLGEKNALKSAQKYIDFSAFSRSGLIKQLEFEGYSKDEATYAVDNCRADWNEQAALSAQKYIDFSAFSRSGLIEQLEFEGYTREQAEYGAKTVGY